MIRSTVPAANAVKGRNIDLYVAAIGDCIRKLQYFIWPKPSL